MENDCSSIYVKMPILVCAEKLENWICLPHQNQELKPISRVEMDNGPITSGLSIQSTQKSCHLRRRTSLNTRASELLEHTRFTIDNNVRKSFPNCLDNTKQNLRKSVQSVCSEKLES